MIDKYSCLILLNDIKEKGINVDKQIKLITTSKSNQIPLEVLKFINDSEPMELCKFYEKLRKSYNDKKSTLYKNLMKDDFSSSTKDISEIPIILNSYALQLTIYGRTAKDKVMLYKFGRLSEVYQCLLSYSTSYDLSKCIKLLQLIKADIKVLESTYRNKN